MTLTDAVYAFPAISTVERRRQFSREATSADYRLHLDFESRVNIDRSRLRSSRFRSSNYITVDILKIQFRYTYLYYVYRIATR